MAFLWAVLPARLVVPDVVGMPARLMPGPADGPPGADALGVAGAWGLGLSVGLWAWGRTVPRGRALVVSVGVPVRVSVGSPSGGACVGLSVGRIGVPWCWRGSRWACVAAAWRAAG